MPKIRIYLERRKEHVVLRGVSMEKQTRPSVVTLSRTIAAVNICKGEDGAARMGLIAQLPKGAGVEICGEGFNERTLKVRWGDRFYFVFSQDINPPQIIWIVD
jgi:hypothetical protein